MAKNKDKKVSERNVLKALNDLEDLVKGNEFEEKDVEGGFSTQGKPLSEKAPRGKGAPSINTMKGGDAGSEEDVEKADASSGDSSDDESSMDKADMDDSESDDSDDSSSDSDGSDEDGDDDSSPMGKSLRTRAGEDEEMSKGLLVSPFLEAMVDQISTSMDDMSKSLAAHVDSRIQKSQAAQQEFNTRMAKGLVFLGRMMKEIVPLVKSQGEMVKSFGNSPNVPQRKSVLNKSEVVHPNGGDGEGGEDGDQPKINYNDVQEWLISKAQANEISPVVITMWEQNNHSLEAIPLPLRKAMMHDLAKAHS